MDFFRPSLPFDTHALSIFCCCAYCHAHRKARIQAKVDVYISDLDSIEWPTDLAPLETPPESISTRAPQGARRSRACQS
jgi:hypothetical protein